MKAVSFLVLPDHPDDMGKKNITRVDYKCQEIVSNIFGKPLYSRLRALILIFNFRYYFTCFLARVKLIHEFAMVLLDLDLLDIIF